MGKNGTLSEHCIVPPGKSFALAGRDPRGMAGLADKEIAKARLAEDAAAIDALQDRLFAEGKRALLVVLQGIDCSGKDGTVRGVFNTSISKPCSFSRATTSALVAGTQ